MKTLVFADPHWNDNIRDSYRHNFVKTLRTIAKEHDPDVIVLCGDLCDQKDKHSAWLVNKVVEHIHSLSQLCPVIILMGNHDYLMPDSPFYGFLGRLDNVVWFGVVADSFQTLISLPRDFRALFLPHTRDWKRDWAKLKFSGYDWVFAHQTFNGANVGFGRKLEGIPLDAVPPNTRVISGDIHVPQQLGPVTYVGAPYLINFGDDYSPRVLLLDGKHKVSIPCPGPQKRLVEISSVNEFALDAKTVGGLGEGDILKVRVNLLPEHKDKWNEIKDKVHKWGEAHGFQINIVQPVFQGTQKAATPTQPTYKDDKDLLNQFAKRHGIDGSMVKTGMWLMERN